MRQNTYLKAQKCSKFHSRGSLRDCMCKQTIFTVVGFVAWPLNGSEAGGDLVLIQTSLLLLCKSSCSYAN